MKIKRAKELIEKFKNLRVFVIGDVMLDKYIIGKVSRISPEAPVPVLEVKKEDVKGGGAGNVFLNLKVLGCDASLLSVVGNDLEGEELKRILGERGVYLFKDPLRPTTVKTRVIAHNQQIVRMDREDTSKISKDIVDLMTKTIDIENLDGILISDYKKGVITDEFMKIIKEKKNKGTEIFVDPKVENIELYKGVTLISPNHGEAERITGMKLKSDDDFLNGARKIKEKFLCKYVVITKGEEGMTFLDEENEGGHLPTKAKEVYDVTGAGDTVISILTLSILSGAKLSEACELANYGASVAVSRLGTTAVSSSELLGVIERDNG
ncbi:MAG: D-glycero-beta-D-manno-heptose-7-phosphate kinase [Candidatus Aminicenantia bacterium]